MKNLSLRPKGDFSYTAEYQKLYVLTEHWKSDLEFYQGDLRFLHHLIDKYFVWFAHKEHLDEMRNLASRLSEIAEKCNGLLAKTSKHLSHLAELIDYPFKYDSHKFRTKHEELENEITSFLKQFREIKKETFTVSEQVIEKDIKRLTL
jgi:cysteinyl-tRNA synthetase